MNILNISPAKSVWDALMKLKVKGSLSMLVDKVNSINMREQADGGSVRSVSDNTMTDNHELSDMAPLSVFVRWGILLPR